MAKKKRKRAVAVSKAKSKGKPRPYLVAEPEGFPGVRIPLVTEEERIALGLSDVKLPPKSSWTEEQRQALDQLGKIVIPIAIYEAVALMAQAVPQNSADADVHQLEREAARLAMPLLMHKKWKNAWTAFHVPRSFVETILQRIAEGQLSILASAVGAEMGKGAKRRVRKARRAKR